MLAHNVLPSVFVLYAGYRYGWTARAVGLVLAGVGVLSVIVQGGLVRRLVPALGERRVLLLGITGGALGFLIYGLAGRPGYFLAGMPIFALMGLFSPAIQGLMTRRVGASEQGQLQGATSSITGVAGLIGPGLFTLTFATFIGSRRDWHVPGAPFLLASGLMFLALVISWRVTASADTVSTP
jgi:DHA1 family tetracycline resistance protein-like MFS transporter